MFRTVGNFFFVTTWVNVSHSLRRICIALRVQESMCTYKIHPLLPPATCAAKTNVWNVKNDSFYCSHQKNSVRWAILREEAFISSYPQVSHLSELSPNQKIRAVACSIGLLYSHYLDTLPQMHFEKQSCNIDTLPDVFPAVDQLLDIVWQTKK